MSQLTYQQVIECESKLEPLSINPYVVSSIELTQINIIGALNPFGHLKYYKITCRDDIHQLIRMTQGGYCQRVKWYYLK